MKKKSLQNLSLKKETIAHMQFLKGGFRLGDQDNKIETTGGFTCGTICDTTNWFNCQTDDCG